MSADWQAVSIGEVAQRIERPEASKPGVTFRQVGVRLWGQGAYERESIDGAETRYSTLSRVETDDIVVNKIWARNGSVAVIPPELAGCYVSTEFPQFVPNRERLEPRWFHWLTKTSGFWQRCDEKSYGTSGKNRIRPEKFLQIKIPLPPLDEQRRIVARIEELAAKVEQAQTLRRQAVAELEAIRRSALSVVYGKLAKAHGLQRLGDLIVNAGYGTSIRCQHERLNNSVPVLRIPNIISGRVSLGDMKYGVLSERELERVLVCPDDILLVRTNGSSDLVGRSAVVPGLPEATAFASYLIRLHCDDAFIDPYYLQTMLDFLRLDGQLFEFARTTAGQYNVSLGRLRAAQLPVPPLSEQRRIVAYLDSLQAKVETVKRHQAATAGKLDALLPSILDKAFKGEL